MAVHTQVLLTGCIVLGHLPWHQKNKTEVLTSLAMQKKKNFLRCRLTMDEEESIAPDTKGKMSSDCYNSVKGIKQH